MANINKITVDGIEYNITIPSGLTEAEQAQIRQNIGAVGQDESNVVQDGTYPAMTVGNATHAQTADDATNAQNDGNGSNIATTYAKISDFDRLILENEYPVGGKPYIQFVGMQTPAQRWAGTSWEIDTDYTGRVLVGSGTGFALGATGGEETHNHDAGRLGANISVSSTGDVYVGYETAQSVATLNYHSGTSGNAGSVSLQNSEIVQVVGSTDFANNMQPYKVVNVWKRTA